MLLQLVKGANPNGPVAPGRQSNQERGGRSTEVRVHFVFFSFEIRVVLAYT